MNDSITLSPPLKWALGIASALMSTGIVALISLSLEQQRDIAVVKSQLVEIQATTSEVDRISREVAILQTQVQYLSAQK